MSLLLTTSWQQVLEESYGALVNVDKGRCKIIICSFNM